MLEFYKEILRSCLHLLVESLQNNSDINWKGHLVILAPAVTGCISISDFAFFSCNSYIKYELWNTKKTCVITVEKKSVSQ